MQWYFSDKSMISLCRSIDSLSCRLFGKLFCRLILLLSATALFSVSAFATDGYVDAQKSNVKHYKVKVLETYPHDIHSYTQGLFFHNGIMYETAGQYGESSFRITDYRSGKVRRRWNFRSRYFAEGSCILGNRIFILTWQEHVCFLFDAKSYKQLGTASYSTEGWGITTNGKDLIMSDGSSSLFFMDPSNFLCTRKLQVTMDGKPIVYLNELEYIDGLVWANVLMEDYILMIDPTTGIVKGKIDCTGILPASMKTPATDVLNGIAYNPLDKSIFITGKYWPLLFRIEVR